MDFALVVQSVGAAALVALPIVVVRHLRQTERNTKALVSEIQRSRDQDARPVLVCHVARHAFRTGDAEGLILRNVGRGPALNIFVKWERENLVGRMADPQVMLLRGQIGPGEEHALTQKDPLFETDYLLAEYQSIFGRLYRTKWSSDGACLTDEITERTVRLPR